MEITHFSVQEEDNIEHINAKSHVFIIWQSNHENRFPHIYMIEPVLSSLVSYVIFHNLSNVELPFKGGTIFRNPSQSYARFSQKCHMEDLHKLCPTHLNNDRKLSHMSVPLIHLH